MKLWEALLKGSLILSPTYKTYFEPKTNCGCAIGTIYSGIGGTEVMSRDGLFYALSLRFPELIKNIKCPVCLGKEDNTLDKFYPYSIGTLFQVIEELFMCHQWSRQRIAEWLVNRELKFKPIEKKEDIKQEVINYAE